MPNNSSITWPGNAMVGYIDLTATGSTDAITQDQVQAYNVIIFGFTNADGTADPSLMQSAENVRQMEAAGTLNLISYGGAGGAAELNADTIQNLVATVSTYNFDGVDLDIEDASVTEESYDTFSAGLREALGSSLLLTAAPILAGSPAAPKLNIPSGNPMEAAYAQDYFDALLVQAYNSGTSFYYPLPSDPTQQDNEASPNIIAAAYNALQKNGRINARTLISIGIPANAGGAPSESNLWNTGPYEAVPPQIGQNLSEITEGQYGIDPAQYGGLMTWSLNTDAMPVAYPGYNGAENGPAGYFAANVAPLVTGTSGTKTKAAE
jgi:chitinase